MGAASNKDRFRVPPPKSIKEVPDYLKKTVGATFSRLFYIFRLVWETQPFLLIYMMFMAIFNGVMPLVGTFITANLLAKVVLSFTEPVNLITPLVLQFSYMFLNTITNSVNSIVVRLAGEKVTNHVKVKIMQKAKTLDVASFDMPDFYERLENANREAGIRPVSILRSSFDLISKLISIVSYFSVLVVILTQLPKISILFFVVYLVLTIISAAIAFAYRRKNHAYMWHRSIDRRQMVYYNNLMVNKDLVKEIRLFDLSDLLIGRYNNVFAGYFKGMRKIILQEGVWNVIMSLLTIVMNGFLFFMIATNVRQIGDYSVYTGALNSISSGLATVISTVATIYEGSLFIDNMILFMKEEQTVKPITDTPAFPVTKCGHTIELKNVSFRVYAELSRDLRTEANTSSTSSQVTYIPLYSRNLTYYGKVKGECLIDGRTDVWYYCKYSAEKEYFGYVYSDFCDELTQIIDNTEQVTYIENPTFLYLTEPTSYTIPENDNRLAIIVGILSVPAIVFLFMIIKGKHILSKTRYKDKEIIDY